MKSKMIQNFYLYELLQAITGAYLNLSSHNRMLHTVCIIETILDRLSMPTNISADIYALMTSCWNTIPSSRPTINQVQQRLKQSIKSEILATPRVSLNMIASWGTLVVVFSVTFPLIGTSPSVTFPLIGIPLIWPILVRRTHIRSSLIMMTLI